MLLNGLQYLESIIHAGYACGQQKASHAPHDHEKGREQEYVHKNEEDDPFYPVPLVELAHAGKDECREECRLDIYPHEYFLESVVVNRIVFGNNALIMEQSATAKRKAALITLLKDPEGEVSSAAAAALERLEGVQSLDSIIVQLKKGNLAAKVRAIYALAEIGGDRVVAPLVYCASRPEDELKGAAIDALGSIVNRSTLKVLTERLKDGNTGIQARAIRALGNFRDPALIPELLPFLDSGDGLTDAEAIIALSRIDNGSLEERFIALTGSPNAATREAAAIALGQLRLA